MNVEQLNDMDDDDFADEVNKNLSFEGDWDLFMQPGIAARTGEVLEEMLTSIEMQLTSHEDDGDAVWLRRAKNFEKLVTWRLRLVRRRISGVSESAKKREKELRAFADKLAVLAEKSNMRAGLLDIYFPFGGLNAQEWIDRRREKRAAEALGVAA